MKLSLSTLQVTRYKECSFKQNLKGWQLGLNFHNKGDIFAEQSCLMLWASRNGKNYCPVSRQQGGLIRSFIVGELSSLRTHTDDAKQRNPSLFRELGSWDFGRHLKWRRSAIPAPIRQVVSMRKLEISVRSICNIGTWRDNVKREKSEIIVWDHSAEDVGELRKLFISCNW